MLLINNYSCHAFSLCIWKCDKEPNCSVLQRYHKDKIFEFSKIINISSVQFSHSVVSNSLRPHESQQARPPCPSPTLRVHPNSCNESVMPSSHLILCRPLLPLPPIPPSIRVFSNESALRMRWPKRSREFSNSSKHSEPSILQRKDSDVGRAIILGDGPLKKSLTELKTSCCGINSVRLWLSALWEHGHLLYYLFSRK